MVIGGWGSPWKCALRQRGHPESVYLSYSYFNLTVPTLIDLPSFLIIIVVSAVNLVHIILDRDSDYRFKYASLTSF